MTEEFRTYAKQVVANSKALAAVLVKKGYTFVATQTNVSEEITCFWLS